MTPTTPLGPSRVFDVETVTALCSRYGLGTPTAAPQAVTGGLIHRVFRLATTTGTFAVKVLDGNIIRRQGVPEQFRRSERIAAAFAAASVPAVLARETPGGTVQEIGDVTVMVYPWCDGEALPKSAAPPPQARIIGATLGRMHALDLRPPGAAPEGPPPAREPTLASGWEELVGLARDGGVAWAAAVGAALPDLLRWDRAAIEAEGTLPPKWVISHGDLDQKNVLWRDGDTPFLIDWESVGAVRPAVELVGAALDWSGQGAGPPERAAFAAVIEGYRQKAEFPSALALPALRCRLGDWLGWLGANMHRSLDPTASGAEVALGVRETVGTLATMYRLATDTETWVQWCG